MLYKESLYFYVLLPHKKTHHVVNSQASVLMLEVQGLNIECSVKRSAVLNPRGKKLFLIFLIGLSNFW